MSMKVLKTGAWKDAEPRGVLVGGAWKDPKKVWSLVNGVWQLVWEAYTPPADKVQYIASQVNSGTSVTSMPAHQAGDLIVIVAQSISSAPPTLASGWTEAHTSTGTTRPLRVGWKVATATNTQSGVWNGATTLMTYVFRGADTTTPFGPNWGSKVTSDTMAITPKDNSGRSQIVYYSYQSGGTGWINLPRALKARNTVVSSFSGEKINSETGQSLIIESANATGYRNLTFEVLAPAPVDPNPPYLYDCTSVSSAGYVVDFTVLDGWPAGDINEGYFFSCSTLTGYDGYVGRNFQRTFRATAFGSFDCQLEDRSNIAGKTLQTISFTCSPRA